jgi:vacuolar protein sorting-associated protein 13A/C
MQVLKVFQSSPDDAEDSSIRPWDPADFEGQMSVLSWKGVGHREAVWQHRYGALAGPFLYLLESSSSQSYKYCARYTYIHTSPHFFMSLKTNS